MAVHSFLKILAVMDDLIAIAIIAFVYTDGVQAQFLPLALILLALFYLFTQRFMIFILTWCWAA